MADDRDVRAHSEWLQTCVNKYVERDAAYNGLWQDDGTAGTLAHMRHKLMRVERLLETNAKQELIEDDAVDLINYTVFLLRLLNDA